MGKRRDKAWMFALARIVRRSSPTREDLPAVGGDTATRATEQNPISIPQPTNAIPKENISATSRWLKFFEHTWVSTILGIGGSLMVPISKWFLGLTSIVFALALHRVGTVRDAVPHKKIGAYMFVMFVGALAIVFTRPLKGLPPHWFRE
jgi:hypothetical protein